jgi:hypothetical protein
VDGRVLREAEETEEEENDDCQPSRLGDGTDGSESDQESGDDTDTDEEL